MGLTRRDLLSGAAAVTAATAWRAAAPAWASRPQQTAVQMPPGTPAYEALVPPQMPTIREAGASRNLLAGCAVRMDALGRDPGYAALVRQQAGIVVAEDAMKFGPLRPAPDQFFFGEADALFAFAEANGMQVRGHTLVGHRQLPGWFDSYVTKENAEAILVQHITTVGARYAGKVHSWDVVNEAVHLEDGLPGGLRNSPWYQLLGPGYLDLAFRTPRQADPKALLCYNDDDLESQAPEQAAKRAAVLALVRGMQSRGVPIDGVGIQSHLKTGDRVRYGAGLQPFLQELQEMGLKLLLTEMDVDDRSLPADTAPRDKTVGEVYGSYLKLALANPAVIALLTSGLTDRYPWRNAEDTRKDGLPERALPFDADLRPVPAYVAEVQAIQGASARS